MKSKVTAPFAAVAGKLSPSGTGRPGGASGNGKAVNGKGKTSSLRRPSVRPAPQSPRPEAAEARDAQLVLARIEPWSVMKFSFLISLVAWVVLFVIVAVLYFTFSALGVFHNIENTIGLVTTSKGHHGSNAASWFSAGTVLGYTMLAGGIDVILITALATFGAAIYNVVTRLSGGIEVTLAEAD